LSFDYQPVLKGKLVELRPLRAEDHDDLYAVAADPLIWEQHPVKNRHEERAFQVFFREALASGGALIAIDANTQQVIGSSRFHGYDKERSGVEIGWTFLARSHWGGSYNGEMKQLMLRYAFRFVSRVIFLVTPENIRSQRAVEKIGAVRVGSRPDAGGRDSYQYQISAATFAQRDDQLEIRFIPARKESLARINDLIVRSKSYRNWPEDYLERALALHKIDPSYLRTNRCFELLDKDAELVAFVAVATTDARVVLDNLWVRSDLIGKGVGRQACEHVFRLAREHDWTELWVVPDHPAVGFYEKMGFSDTGERVPSHVPGGPVFSVYRIDLSEP